jgi:hypothetical protein
MHLNESPALASSAIVSLCAFALAGCGGQVADQGGNAGAVSSEDRASDVPPLPSPALEVPAGNRLAFDFDAIGVQTYTCNGAGTWVNAPIADLYDKNGKIVGKHYVGPTWEFHDGSTVLGKKIAAATPDTTAIPWLLLQAIGHNDVDGRMTDVTYVQRLETAGGVGPAASACDASQAGVEVDVRYTATYYFYRAEDD